MEIKRILLNSPFYIIAGIVFGLFSFFFIFFNYYYHILNEGGKLWSSSCWIISCFTALMHVFARFGFALSGSLQMMNDNRKGAMVGFSISGAMTIYNSYESYNAAAYLFSSQSTFLFFVFLGVSFWTYVCEIRLATLMSDLKKLNNLKESTSKKIFDEMSRKEKRKFIRDKHEQFKIENGRNPLIDELIDYAGIKDKITKITVMRYLGLA